MPAFLQSELPVLARTRHHWVVMLRRPHLIFLLALALLLVAAVVDPMPMALLLLAVVGAFAYLRWQMWRAEWVIVTRRRIVRVRGIPETTTAEASLRLDRISGAVLEQTVMGKLLDYGTIELEAPGEHPDVRRIVRIARPQRFYMQVRKAVFGNEIDFDPDVPTQDFVTAPLPRHGLHHPRR